MRCIAKTLKGKRCKNGVWEWCDTFREAQRCRMHYWRLSEQEMDEVYRRLWEKKKETREQREKFLEMTRMVSKLPALKVSVRSLPY